MRKFATVLVLAALALILGTAPSAASAVEPAEETIEIKLRAAPAGPVVPSLILVSNPSTWIVDPAEDKRFNEAPGVAGCYLDVSDRNGDGFVDGVDVLDRAAEAGCITSWEGRNDSSCTDGSDVFVAEVDGLEEVYPATFWLAQRNGELANNGVCGMALTDGETLGFVYQ